MNPLLALSIYTVNISNRLSLGIHIKWMNFGKRARGRLGMQTELCIGTLFEDDRLEDQKCDEIFILKPISNI
jgi:hypothetical protein